MENRKLELERLERIMFPTIRPTPGNNLDTVEKGEAQDDVTKTPRRDIIAELQETFVKLRNAAGVTKTEDVFKRFLGQRITKERLQVKTPIST